MVKPKKPKAPEYIKCGNRECDRKILPIMNKLTDARRAAIVRALCEGNSIRATTPLETVATGTVAAPKRIDVTKGARAVAGTSVRSS
jgi:hypothetical protein